MLCVRTMPCMHISVSVHVHVLGERMYDVIKRVCVCVCVCVHVLHCSCVMVRDIFATLH